MKKYYVMPADASGNRQCIDSGVPVDMTGVKIVELPNNDGYLKVISRNKYYEAYKVAKAIVAGQINIEDVEVSNV
jgi:hypothetical protein